MRSLSLLFLLYPATPVFADEAELVNLANCWNKSIEYLDQAKCDIDSNYEGDPWYAKHMSQSAKCREIREKMKKNKSTIIPCYIQEDRKFKCKIEQGSPPAE